ncbi:uri-1 [Pristionchus pacificus]|uniref:Uri-1 n=1 Tax=Pristionchus pacificus TaxID=54126 RepID=A0A2A6BU32_PRIPA|nr:uri-1 [Pristionchus pacificus]|eukprot:PDM69261.1 uri-1 [Pristionchus pacificus]
MADRMPPSTIVHDNPAAAAAAGNEAAVANFARLQKWIERECAECDAAIDEHRKQVDDYRTQKGRLLELQKKISHPIMVPFGSVGFMPGKLVRTNEVLVLLGANHFAECSVHDTSKIIDRRIRGICSLIEKLESQKRNASERLNFAQGLFGAATTGAKDDLVEIREDYDEKKEAEARRKRAARAAAAREDKKVPQATFEDMMSRLDELEKQEERAETRGGRSDSDDEDDDEVEEQVKEVKDEEEMEQGEDGDEGKSEEEEEEATTILKPPKGVNVEDSDDLSDSEEQKHARFDAMRKERSAEDRRAMIERELRERRSLPLMRTVSGLLKHLRIRKGIKEATVRKSRRRSSPFTHSFFPVPSPLSEKEKANLVSVLARGGHESEREINHLFLVVVPAKPKCTVVARTVAVQSQQLPPTPRRPLIEVIEEDVAPPPHTVSFAPQPVAQFKPQPKMTVVSENDRVVDLVEYQNQQEDDDKSKENAPAGGKGSKLTHKRSVRFKKNLEAGPCEQKSIDSVDDVLPSLDTQPNPRSILRNKSEESPIDKIAFSEMEDQRSTTILPSGDAFSGCVVERSAELPIIFKPVDEPPRRVSRFKLQRMQQATE